MLRTFHPAIGLVHRDLMQVQAVPIPTFFVSKAMQFRPTVILQLSRQSQLSRRGLLSSLFALFSGLSAHTAWGQQFGQQFGQQRRYRDGAQVNFKQQLEQGLEARRPEEFAFIDLVVRLVDQNRLPRVLVETTFQWARKKRPYPFVYFRRGLRVRAARLRITALNDNDPVR